MRIYVSSTYQDLVEERRATLEAIRRLEHQPVGMEDYGAAESRPLDKCVADVKSCGAYVGLLAWRYGFIPNPATGKSITRLEYETAGDASIPRLIFLSPERNEWMGRTQDPNPVRIQAFRKWVQDNHLVAPFTDKNDLRFKVAADLSREIGRGKPIPDLLPYRCNREPQQTRLGQFISEREPEVCEKPLFCVLNGLETQCHHKFIDCLKERYLARQLGSSAEELCVNHIDLPWPKSDTPTEFEKDFIYVLGQKVCRPGAPLQEIARSLSALQTPVIFSIRLPIRNWSAKMESLLDVFVKFWLGWKEPLRCLPAIMILYAEYPDKPASLISRLIGRGSHRARAEISKAFGELAERYADSGCFLLLPTLSDVDIDDVRDWLLDPDVEAFSAGGNLESKIGTIFVDRDAMPMQPLAGHLRKLLETHVTHGVK